MSPNLLLSVLYFAVGVPLLAHSSTDSQQVNENIAEFSLGEPTAIFDEPVHFCKLLESSRSVIPLQSITIDNKNIFIIEDDNVYSLPKDYLNSTENVLYMFNPEKGVDKDLVKAEKWYEMEKFMINSAIIAKDDYEEKGFRERYSKKNEKDKLKSLHLFVTDLNKKTIEKKPQGSDYGLLRSYVFHNNEEYLMYKKLDGQDVMLMDSIRDCRAKDDISLCHRHDNFRAATDGLSTDEGLMFYYDTSEKNSEAIGRKRRVLIAPLAGQADKGCTVEPHREELNFPSWNNSNLIGSYMRAGSGRLSIELFNYETASNQVMDKKGDYYFHLPYGLITDARVYLFSVPQRRVYFVDRDQLIPYNTEMGGVSIVKSKSFQEFFICSPTQKIVPDNQASREPKQDEYIIKAQSYFEPTPKENAWFNFDFLLAGIIFGCSFSLGLLLCVVLYRLKKIKKKYCKQHVGSDRSKSTSTSLSKSTRTGKK